MLTIKEDCRADCCTVCRAFGEVDAFTVARGLRGHIGQPRQFLGSDHVADHEHLRVPGRLQDPLHVGRRHQVEAEIDMRRGAPMDLPVAGGDRGPKLNSTWERLLAHRVDPDRVLRVQHITEGLAETRS